MDGRAIRRSHATRLEQVLVRHRQAMQRPERGAMGLGLIGGPRLRPCALRVQGDDGVDGRVRPRNLGEMGLE